MFIITYNGTTRHFSTLDAATGFASRVFTATGLVVAILAATDL